ncbi:hypothetical protein BV22DRAFT_1026132 [Leucogyrophana mollusca]|uniref:Uncharacterized protein n=1 Tax=Leucogyrophana mollusca TaxID=85980 RepID=A0ACB8AWJ9_9AGAM|nr:hypothetical protein BV22DRAFT_1026132 [Leucogyrophana mollusca]
MSQFTGASSEDPLIGGAFDEDEADETLKAARKLKSTQAGMIEPEVKEGTGRPVARTTAQMGVVFKRKDVNDAVREAKEEKRNKPLKDLKATDLPFKDNTDHKLWDNLVRALLDWAGTVDDPFGTNEHPDLTERLQELWNLFFTHLPLDVTEYPAIKKLVSYF